MTAVFVRPDAMNHCKNLERILQEILQQIPQQSLQSEIANCLPAQVYQQAQAH
jgi:hypothetical protein